MLITRAQRGWKLKGIESWWGQTPPDSQQMVHTTGLPRPLCRVLHMCSVVKPATRVSCALFGAGGLSCAIPRGVGWSGAFSLVRALGDLQVGPVPTALAAWLPVSPRVHAPPLPHPAVGVQGCCVLWPTGTLAPEQNNGNSKSSGKPRLKSGVIGLQVSRVLQTELLSYSHLILEASVLPFVFSSCSVLEAGA